MPLRFADAIFGRERSDDPKCVSCSQASLNGALMKKKKNNTHRQIKTKNGTFKYDKSKGGSIRLGSKSIFRLNTNLLKLNTEFPRTNYSQMVFLKSVTVTSIIIYISIIRVSITAKRVCKPKVDLTNLLLTSSGDW